MKPENLKELHFITPIQNLDKILEHGILSHNRAAKINHVSMALEAVQERRRKVTVPGGRKLHDYVNLYFHARNPMLYKRLTRHKEICVLRISREVIHLPDVVVSDMNASSDYVRFAEGERGLLIVDDERVFAQDWTHPDPIEYYRRKAMKCAEVLVPDRVDTTLVTGAYVSCAESEQAVRDVAPDFPVEQRPHLFFR